MRGFDNARAREFLTAERARRGDACELRYAGCRRTKQLEFAHTKPTPLDGRGRGMIRRALDIRKHPDSYVLACRRCHLMLDRTGQPTVPGAEEV